MTSFLAWIHGLLRGVATNVAAFFAGSWWQKEKGRRKSAEKRLKDVEDAKEIHERLASDDDYAKRLRDKYTR